MDKVYNLVQNIRHLPEIHLGKKSLHLLQAFLHGYIEYHNEITGESNYFFLPEFQKYVEQRFNINTTHSWASLITFYSSSDEDAFNNFYKILDEFFSENAN
ncbi:hypothetical protein [Cohnella abietis]|uniref:hypothetical protein n=1 Tax=Cohnella abietis TaxID=2507935 RepID=UPI00102E9A4C|nr:hypothetical protein [Cohnella abietis]